MTTTHRHRPQRKLDVAGLVLLLIGIVFGIFSYWLIVAEDVNALVLVPSVVAATLGATSLTKIEAQH